MDLESRGANDSTSRPSSRSVGVGAIGASVVDVAQHTQHLTELVQHLGDGLADDRERPLRLVRVGAQEVEHAPPGR